ncbi:lipase precursor [Stachybotrys elegans]|uniref:Lipase n=1 Tax=Stachybotrys elegans TaxID=80388 RepID=A0A8K0WS76_9HYPO|nr:lipase precursor [Stachybotrys elegans]
MHVLSLLALAACAVASPLSARDYIEAVRSLGTRASVTEQQLSDLNVFAEYAGASYCNIEVAAGSAITCSGGVCPTVEGNRGTIVQTFTGLVTGIGGFVAVDNARREIILSIRGSNNVRNFITDVIFVRTGCDDLVSGCSVHAGFAAAWKEIARPATAAIASALAANPGYRIVATGHSLGAVVATLAAAYLRRTYSVDIYSYGAPRLGNAVLSQFITDQPGAEFRVTHIDDPVPRLPPMVFGYRHISPEYWLSTGSSTDTDYTVDDIRVCEGIANVKCNAGTTIGLNIDAHNHYLGPIAGCGPPIEFRRQDDITDEELAERLRMWAIEDQELAAVIN